MSTHPGGAGLSIDHGGDGKDEDTNGNRRADLADVVWLFNHLSLHRCGRSRSGPSQSARETIEASGNLTVREGENVTFSLRVGPDVPLPSGTGSGWSIRNDVRVDPVVAPTPYPEPTKTYGPYPTLYNYTPSYTLRDVRANHTVYGVFYKAGWITC